MKGSSPRGRGKRFGQEEVAGVEGLIPAWAGKTCPPRTRLAAPWAHPRVGGENARKRWKQINTAGSSPRGRGKHGRAVESVGERRLIPAWAGKTRTARRRPRPGRAHPRVGGENDASQVTQTTGPGSSPRGRGKPNEMVCEPQPFGLIPAWAGKTWRNTRRCGTYWAHPRVGGENASKARGFLGAAGSSPRGRGKRGKGRGEVRVGRLIPAWAGKTLDARAWRWPAAAHPRVGGEN